jgi:GntR family transcriptional regulator, rspAB operon transcriptional repressor
MDSHTLPSIAAEEMADFVVDDLEHLILGRPSARHHNKSVIAYSAVRRAIVKHDLPASTPLDEAVLQKRFDIGRTPLREALKRLTHERFLVWPPRQAPTIRDVSLEELSRLFETRMILEPQIARLAAQRATTEDGIRFRRLCHLLKEATGRGDTYLSVELDFAFHAAVADSTRNRFLREASDNLNRQSLRLWYRSQRAHGIENVDVLHLQLADAITQGDVTSAYALAREHVERSIDRQNRLHGWTMSD